MRHYIELAEMFVKELVSQEQAKKTSKMKGFSVTDFKRHLEEMRDDIAGARRSKSS